MKIMIKSPGEKAIRLVFPTRMIFNGFTAKLGATSIKKYVSTEDLSIRSTDLKRFVKEINRLKHKYPDLELVNIEGSDGERVIIKL